ncbi:MAG: uroporphyrinogen-III synthase [Thiotrichales bacterium]|nr:uroporphyrinogen-III synthase [Thiotrichales bacterium]
MCSLTPTFTLLNTRPEHQAQGLTELVKAAGGQALSCPTLAIALKNLPVKRSVLNRFDKVVFISVNAVNSFVQQIQRLPQSEQACQNVTNWYAIGKATFHAAQKVGLQITTLSGQQFDSESLLQHPSLQHLKGQKVLIVKGDNGRELLADSFEQRGALVESWSLYRREPLRLCTDAWLAFKTAQNPQVLATSVASLESLLHAFDGACATKETPIESQQACSKSHQTETFDAKQNQAWLVQQPLVVFSQRIKDWAVQQGWQGKISVVTTQSDQGVIDCIIESLRDN